MTTKPLPGRRRLFGGLLVLGLPALALGIRAWLWAPYGVESDGMAPSLLNSEVVGVWKGAEPEIGDVVAYVPRGEAAASFKRVVAIGPAEVEVGADGELLVDGESPLTGEQTSARLTARGCEGGEVPLELSAWGEARVPVLRGGTPIQAVSLPDGSYYLLGDNRPGASDSRHVGPIEAQQIVGVATRVLWSSDSCTGETRWERMGVRLR